MFKVGPIGPLGLWGKAWKCSEWPLGALKAHSFTKWTPCHEKCGWVGFFWMQRLWACIFHNLALRLAVSAPALEDYINCNPSCPRPATAVPVTVGFYWPSLF